MVPGQVNAANPVGADGIVGGDSECMKTNFSLMTPHCPQNGRRDSHNGRSCFQRVTMMWAVLSALNIEFNTVKITPLGREPEEFL